MRSGIRKISSRVLESCSSLPPIVNLMLRECGTSSLVTDRRSKGREGVEAIPQRPLTGGHLNVARAHVIHDRVTEACSCHRSAEMSFPPLPMTNANSAS